IVLSTGAKINGISGSDIEKLLELGLIGGVNTENIESVEPTPKSNVTTYELKQLGLTQRIKKAQPGDTVTISEKQLDKGKLPAYAMVALAAADGVSLMIVCDDLAVIIRSDEAVADCGSKMFYTIDELVKMYE
ncbi:MAG: hypothetical protein PUD43_10685, partial [Clostridia bacterium]|nr:hypothetical protein [Clostridia bacterium]